MRTLALLLFAWSARADITYIDSRAKQVTATQQPVTVAMDTTAGVGASLFVMSMTSSGGGDSCASGVVDSQSNTWRVKTIQNSGSVTECLWYAYDKAGAALSTSATHTFSGPSGSPCSSQICSIFVTVYGGTITQTADPLDQTAAGANSASASSLATGSITPSQNCELIVSGAGLRSSITYTNDVLTVRQALNWSAGTLTGGAIADTIQTTAGAINATWSMAGTGQLAVNMVSFKAASCSVGAASVPHRVVGGGL